ncbi:oligosaccharide flippase family protein [Pontixanthobacter aquaemixtae]|nr:oligosaccharide flippase family protein [Pontixanthobacter aquaemixtae]
MTGALRKLVNRGSALAAGPIARGSIVSVLIRITGLTLSFVQAIIAARLLGVDGYGLVAVALSVAHIAAAFALFGYGTLATREIAGWLASGKQHLLGKFARHAVVSVLGISALSAIVIFAASPFLAEYRSVILVAAAIIPAVALIQLLRGMAQGFGDVSAAQWPGEILRPAMLIALVVCSLAFIPDVTAPGFLIMFAMASLCSALAGAILVRRHMSARNTVERTANTETSDNPAFFGKAAPFFALSMLAIVQGEFATIMLALFASPEQAGLYQPIARLTPIIALPATAAAMRYAPRVSEFWNSGQMSRLADVTRTYTLATCGLTTAVTITLAGLGPLILLAFGPDFTAVAPLLWIVGAGQIFNTATGPVGYLLTMTGHVRMATISKVLGVVAALVAAVLLVPHYGATGAAIAVSVGLIAWNTAALIATRRLLGFDPSLLQLIGRRQPATGREL